MTPSIGLDWIRETMWTAVVAGAPVILTVAIIGLALAILQAATQVNDAAVPFAAKAIGVFVALTMTGAWMLGQMTDFAQSAFEAMAHVTGG
ncbi:MAG: flagellar biosynthetic protein FliQ [Sandaracinaceae bacterium]|tara:strand:+ start:455 stop:727 length:273 start_codon:yes stop_codon:yes gene_type:complete